MKLRVTGTRNQCEKVGFVSGTYPYDFLMLVFFQVLVIHAVAVHYIHASKNETLCALSFTLGYLHTSRIGRRSIN